MLNCEYCTYYKRKGKTCQFSSCLFAIDEEKSDMEFPCRDEKYLDYLISKTAQDTQEAAVM